jgi:N-acetylglucosamine-6-sulfatase
MQGTKLVRPPSYNERDMSDKPEGLRRLPRFSKEEKARIQQRFVLRLERMHAVGRGVEAIGEALDQRGRSEDTYVIFTSDNGYHLGEHRLHFAKTTHYEESMRVPLTVSGPGIDAGTVVPHIALNNDLAPTIADLGGAAAPNVDGSSLVPVLREGTRPRPREWRSRFLNANWHHNWYMRWPATRAVRTRTHLYAQTNGGDREFYDLRVDPYQLDSAHRGMRAAQRSRYNGFIRDLKRCQGAEQCRAAEGFAP